MLMDEHLRWTIIIVSSRWMVNIYKMTAVISQRGNISEVVCSLEPYAGFE